MNTFTRLVKDGKIGRLCKTGAWIIAAIGTVQIVGLLYSSWQIYHQIQAQSQDPALGQNLYLFGLLLTPNLSSAFQAAASTIFYFVILYAAGAIINSIFAPVNNDITFEPIEEEKSSIDDITYEPIEEEKSSIDD